MTTKKPIKSANEPFQYVSGMLFGGNVSPTATSIIALVAAVGIHWNVSVNILMARKTNPAEKSPLSGDLTPVVEFTADRERDPDTGIPPKKPFTMFAVPKKTSSCDSSIS